jgi:hypothetical protein
VRIAAAMLVMLLATAAAASPNVSLDDSAYEELTRLRLLGQLPGYSGGIAPLTQRRVRALLGGSPVHDGWWLAPVERLRLTASLFEDTPRPYSTTVRPRDLSAGSISIACERQEARPCGDGAGIFGEVESSGGYAEWLSASIRLRAETGDAYPSAIALDRGYVNAELGPVAAEVGRDVLVLGPSARTQLGWGANAAPITHARISTSAPYPIASNLHASALYVVGRLRAPQQFPHALVSIARVQLDIADSVELGTTQVLQLGGEGRPSLSVWDFVAEHLHRKDSSASETDSSNRRFGGDIAVRISELRARLYYALMFEDIRRARLIDAVRYDADHLFGADVAVSRNHGLVLEWHHTGFRSYEHSPGTTGFTHLGHVVGAALGPDATSLYAGARSKLAWGTLYPELELVRLSSDTYELVVDGPINRLTRGVAEWRYRAGTRLKLELRADLQLQLEVLFEHVQSFAFDPAQTRNNVGASASLFWYPQQRLGR